MEQQQPASYKEAADELNTILQELEGEDVTVDDLAQKVKRASFLLKYCKEKLKGAETEVNTIIADLKES